MSDRVADPAQDGVRDIRPIVASAVRPLPIALIAAGVVAAALLLFALLESRRASLGAPAVRMRAADRAQLPGSPPPLFIPPEPRRAPQMEREPLRQPEAPPLPAPPLPARPAEPQPVIIERIASPPVDPEPSPRTATAGPVLVIDNSAPAGAPATPATGESAATPAPAKAERVRPGRIVRRETTLRQGSLIPAVLETALDSTRPGQARALVTRDVRGYGGTYVLIPRGSRLYGEYRADLARGQNRALVQWTRLDRPDGVTIALDSPAADTLGRAGIRGRVNSHFFERFGSAILQSSLDLGVGIAARSVGNAPVIIGLPTGGFGGQQLAQPQQVQPTLKVRQGTRITVFVARDLDFTGAERR